MSATLADQQSWDSLIRTEGDRCAFRQNGVDRPISASIQRESSMERTGQVSNPLDRVAFVSALDPDTGLPILPPSEKDVLVAPGGILLKIVAPPDSMGASVLTMYYRIKVRA